MNKITTLIKFIEIAAENNKRDSGVTHGWTCSFGNFNSQNRDSAQYLHRACEESDIRNCAECIFSTHNNQGPIAFKELKEIHEQSN